MGYKQKLADYLQGAEKISTLVKDFPDELLNYRPERKDAWTIKEHIIHLVDSEINGFIRCKSIIAQPFSDCYVMHEEEWTRNLSGKNEDHRKYLQVFGLIRSIVYDLLKDEPEENFTKDYFTRDYKGEKKNITLAGYLELYGNHLGFHIDYIRKVMAEFKAAKVH